MKKLVLFAVSLVLFSLAGAEKSKALVLYYSWSDAGNTRQVASIIAKETGAPCEMIEPVKKYSRKYSEVLKQGRMELKQPSSCPIKPLKNDLKKYDVIFIGTPIWFGTYAPPVRTLLQQNLLKGKKVYFFCTHGKGGPGTYFKDAAKLVPGAVVGKGFNCYGVHVKKIAPQVKTWLKKDVKR